MSARPKRQFVGRHSPFLSEAPMGPQVPMADRAASVRRGIDRLQARFRDRFNGSVDHEVVYRYAQEAVEGWPETLSPDYLALLIESLTVAVVARQLYDERPLDLAEVRAYLAHSVSFFNSFVHP